MSRALKASLRSKITGMKYGYIRLLGQYSEINESTGMEEEKEEFSVCVPSLPWRQGVKLGNEFDQDSILYKKWQSGLAYVSTNERTGVPFVQFMDQFSEAHITNSDLVRAYSVLIKSNRNNKVDLWYLAELDHGPYFQYNLDPENFEYISHYLFKE